MGIVTETLSVVAVAMEMEQNLTAILMKRRVQELSQRLFNHNIL